MKKLLTILASLAIVATLIVILFITQIDSVVKMAVEWYGSEITGVSVKLSRADVALLKGESSLSSLSIGNPPGFKSPTAFAVERISIKIDPKSLKTDKVIVQTMSIESPRIDYELDGGKNNFEIIREHVKKSLAETSMQGSESAIDKKQIIINDLYVKNGSISVSAPMIAGQTYKVALPDIHLQNLGKDEKPGNLPNLIQQIMMVLTGDVISAVGNVTVKNFSQMLLKNTTENPANAVQKGVEGIGKDIGNIIPR